MRSLFITCVSVLLVLAHSLNPTQTIAEEGIFLGFGGPANVSKTRSLKVLDKKSQVLIGSNDKCIRLLDLETLELATEFRFQIGRGRVGEVTSNIAVTKDQERFAFGRFGDGRRNTSDLYVVQISPRKIIRHLKGDPSRADYRHRSSIQIVRFFDGGKKLVSVDLGGLVLIWDLATGAVEQKFNIRNASVLAMSVNRSDQALMTTTNGSVYVLELSPLRQLAKRKIGREDLDSALWLSDNSFITIGRLGRIQKWQYSNGNMRQIADKKVQENGALSALEVDTKKKEIYFFFGRDKGRSSAQGQSLRVMDYNLKELRRPSAFQDEGVQVASISAKRREMLVARFSGGLEKWDLRDMHRKMIVPSEADNMYVPIFDKRNQNSSRALSLIWAHNPSESERRNPKTVIRDKAFRINGLVEQKRMGLYEPSRSRQQQGLETFDIRVGGTKYGLRAVNGQPRNTYLVNIDTGQPAGKWAITPNRHGDKIIQRRLLTLSTAIISTNKGTFLFNTRSGNEVGRLSNQLGGVHAITISPDRKFMATYSAYDRSVAIWGLSQNVNRPTYLATLFVMGNEWAIVSDRGFFECTPAAEKYVGWHVNQGPREFAEFHELDRFRNKFSEQGFMSMYLIEQDHDIALGKLRLVSPSRGTVKQNLGPKISIETPTEDEVTQKNSQKLKITVSYQDRGQNKTGGIGLRINDSPPQNENFHRVRESAVSPQKYTFDISLVEGRQRISAQAYSRNSRNTTISDRTLMASFNPYDLQKNRKLFYLGVGINDYKHSENYGKLKFCRSDVEQIGEIFREGAQGAYKEDPKIVTLDRIREKDDFANSLTKLLQDSNGKNEFRATDTLVIMWSGHGDMNNDNDYFLVLPETVPPAPNDDSGFRKTGLSATEILRIIRESAPDGNVILIVDACYSGGLLDDFNDSRKRLASEANDDDLGIMVIAAADADQESKEPEDLGMSNFAFLLKHGLLGLDQFRRNNQNNSFVESSVAELDSGPIVTTRSLVRFLQSNMQKLTDEQTIRTNGIGQFSLYLAKPD